MPCLTYVIEIRPPGSPLGLLQGPVDIHRPSAQPTTQEPNTGELLARAGMRDPYGLTLLKCPTCFLGGNNRGMVPLGQLLARLLLARRDPLRPTPCLDSITGIKPGTIQDIHQRIKIEVVALTDSLQADVLIQVELVILPYRPPGIAGILLSTFSLIDLRHLPQGQSPLSVPAVARWCNPSIEPSCFLLSLNAALHPGNNLFLLLGAHNTKQRRKKPLVVIREVNHVREGHDLDVVLDKHFLDAAQVSQVIRSSEAVEIRYNDGVKAPFGSILEQREKRWSLFDQTA